MDHPAHQPLVLKACGQHHGFQPGPCAKCRHFAELRDDAKYQKGLQYNGTPWHLLLEPAGDPNVQTR